MPRLPVRDETGGILLNRAISVLIVPEQDAGGTGSDGQVDLAAFFRQRWVSPVELPIVLPTSEPLEHDDWTELVVLSGRSCTVTERFLALMFRVDARHIPIERIEVKHQQIKGRQIRRVDAPGTKLTLPGDEDHSHWP